VNLDEHEEERNSCANALNLREEDCREDYHQEDNFWEDHLENDHQEQRDERADQKMLETPAELLSSWREGARIWR
jgi:hypothetical protein